VARSTPPDETASLNIFGFVVKSITVDSIPILQGPPSIIILRLVPNSSATCFAVVGLKDFDLLALGAASGQFKIFNNFIAFFSLGILTAIVARPLFASLDIFDVLFFFKYVS